MQRLVIVLLGMASLVASGVIMDRGRVNLNSINGLGLQNVQGIRDIDGVRDGDRNVLTRDDLLRQKFILDILQQVDQPLQQQDLLELDDGNTVSNENLYIRPLTQEMLLVLDLIRSNQMLGKHNTCTLNNKQHIRQMVGLYRLLVTARDFNTFQRLVVYARQNINTEMFVNTLVLALGERRDTQMLIVPALHEILPQLFHKDHVIDQVRQLDTGVSSIRPQLIDVMGMGRRTNLLNNRIADQQDGLMSVLNRSQLWMPWRELHKQIGLRRMMGGNVMQQDVQQVDKVIVTLPGNGLLTQDVGLKTFVNILIDELIVNQDTVRNINRNQIGRDGQVDNDDIVTGIRGNRRDNNMHANSQQFGRRVRDDDMELIDNLNRFNIGGRRFDMDDDENTENRRFNTGRRQGINFDTEINRNRNINSRRLQGLDIDTENTMNRNRVMMGGRRAGNIRDDDILSGRRFQNRYDTLNEYDMDDDIQVGRRNIQQGQNGINTVSSNDARLLFVGRRHKNPNTVLNLNENYNNDNDDFISGGRRVSNDNKCQSNQYCNDDEDDNNLYIIREINKNNRRGNNQQDDEDLFMRINQNRFNNGNTRDVLLNRQINDNFNRNTWGQDQRQGLNTIRGRNDFLNMITRGNIGGQRQRDDSSRSGGQWQTLDNERKYMNQRQLNDDEDLMLNQGWTNQRNKDSLDMHLPTTSIHDERLLHINRRKLNSVNEGRRVNHNNNRQGDFDDDEYTRFDNQRDNLQHGNWNVNRRDNQNEFTGGRNNLWNMNRLGEVDNDNNDNQHGQNHGRRNRRSIVNQNVDQENTINGKLVLHNLQQLVARLNVERIALGQQQLIDETLNNLVNDLQTNNLGQNIDIRGVNVQTVNKIENILQHIDYVLQQKIGQISVATYNQKVNEIGLLLAGEIQELGLIEILGEIQQTSQRKGQVANIIENQAVQILLAGIVKIVDQKVQQVFKHRQEFINTVNGININNVNVDKLQTYLEETEVDLTNLLINKDIQQNRQGNQKVVVGRVPRLNHRSFKIDIDVTSDRQQQVVVRNLLVPKVDGNNNLIPLKERRQNVIVLDIATVQLQQGRNNIQLHSNDITLTGRDTTPLTKIYQLVMQALNGDIQLQQNQLAGQSTLLPHHLLLPRGRINGLPMQLITVITTSEGNNGIMGRHTSTGLNTLLHDRLPLNYPLHCDITDLDRVVSMPNLVIKDVKIYHEDNTQNINMY